MRNIKAVFTKQIFSYFKNPAMLGTPIAFLSIPLAILLLMPGVAETERSLIVSQFVIMFIGISMIGTSAGFIAEDRQTMNLRFMSMSGVKPYQYLIATCLALLVISLAALLIFGLLIGETSLQGMLNFLAISMLGAAGSMLLGITLSLSKFAPFTPIIGILLGVGPIFADTNETLANIFHYTFTQQVNTVIRGGLSANIYEAVPIILINIAILLVAFIAMNARNGLDGERLSKKK